MRVKISYLKIIMIMMACTALYFMICPWYVKGVAGIYTRNFADVLNSHNTKSYDRFFSKDTIFELNGKQITYADAKENMEKMQAFTSRFSYGHLEEWTNRKEFFAVAISKEHPVCLRLPIVADQYGGPMFIEGDIILERKCLFLFKIKKVSFDEEGENERFFKDFLGV